MQLKQNNMPLVANQYTYDAMSRLATVSDGTNTATYSRISGSNLLNTTTITAGGSTRLTTTRNYDSQNRLTSISSVSAVPSVVKTYSYTYDDKDRRSRLDMADGSYWTYTYDAKGQIVSGTKYDSSNKAIPGQAFTYAYDDIGNMTSEQRGMTEMQFDYTSNLVNQYTQRLVPGIIPVTGQASADSTVSVWLKNHGANAAAVTRPTRDGEYFKAAIPVNNTAANVTEALEITAVKFNTTLDKDVVKTINGTYTVPKTPQVFTYDDDGNMTGDGVWSYTWNGENRLVKAEKANDKKVEFAYDYIGRRTEKKTYAWVNGAWSLTDTEKYVYDGWNLIAVYNDNSVLQKSYLWGIDLSGSLQGAGGVGGLLAENSNSTSYYTVYDGNGNVRAYIDTAGTLVAEYEYGPFGQIVSKYGSLADNFSFRFSTKFLDAETGLYYYGIRYYTPEFMRWLSQDPMGEEGGVNLYVFVNNNGINLIDGLGLKIYAISRGGNNPYSYPDDSGDIFVLRKTNYGNITFTTTERRKACWRVSGNLAIIGGDYGESVNVQVTGLSTSQKDSKVYTLYPPNEELPVTVRKPYSAQLILDKGSPRIMGATEGIRVDYSFSYQILDQLGGPFKHANIDEDVIIIAQKNQFGTFSENVSGMTNDNGIVHDSRTAIFHSGLDGYRTTGQSLTIGEYSTPRVVNKISIKSNDQLEFKSSAMKNPTYFH